MADQNEVTAPERNPPIKILMVIPSYFPLVGGAEQQLLLLADELRRSGHSVTVVTRQIEQSPSYESVQGTTVYRLPSRPYPVRFLFRLLIFLIRRRRDFDLIHVHTLNSPLLVCAFWGNLAGVPVIAKVTGTGHGSQIHNYQSNRVRRWLFAATARRIRGFIAITSEVRATLRQANVPDSSIFVIPNGVAIPNQEYRHDVSKLRICYVGRLIASKRVEWLIDAVAELRRENRLECCEVHIIGGGIERSRLENLVEERGLGDISTFHGMLDREDVQRRMRQYSCFVLPSEREGLSNALLEAMAAGLLAIASDLPANRTLISPGENGLLFKDIRQLKECIAAASSDTEHALKLAENGKMTIQRKFAIDQIAQEYVALYRTMV